MASIGLRWSLYSGLTFLLIFAALHSPRLKAAEENSVNGQLRDAVVEEQKKLGALEPWQVRIFQEEIVPQFQRFIKDYRQNPSGGVTVEIDHDSIRRYLQIYAPKVLKQKDYHVLVCLHAEPNCPKCQAAVGEIRSLVSGRLERRGFIPVWLTPEESGEGKYTGKALNENVSDLTLQRNAAGSLVLQWQVAPVDDLDSAHAEEERYLIQSFVQLREVSKNEGKMDLLANDRFEPAAMRLLTDAFTEIGARAELAQGEGTKELGVVVTGFRDFSDLMRIKAALVSGLKDVVSLEERRIARGKVIFAVRSSKTRDELAREVAALRVESFAGVPGVKWVHLEIQ